MHGLGNDYVYVNCFEEKIDNPPAIAAAISERHFGVGSDGLILICPSKTADAKMRMFNADGSEAQMCGNGIRCLAKYVYDHKIVRPREKFQIPSGATLPAAVQIETARGILTVGLDIDENDKVRRVCVNMGQPILRPADIPVNIKGETAINVPIELKGRKMATTCVSMGNPHAVFFCDDLESIVLEHVGPMIEHHPLFPQRVNAHFVRIDSPNKFTMKTWERGSGITLACGTGACASLAAAVLCERCRRNVIANLPGGALELVWNQADNCIYMTGPAIEVFTGDWPL